jgi:hypothetical protein
MPYGMRVLAVLAGGAMFVAGLVMALDALHDGGDTMGLGGISGLGLGLMVTAFVPRD